MEELKEVKFEEVPFLSRSFNIGPPRRPKMLDLVMKTGLVKTEKAGGIFLVFISIFFFLLSFVILLYFVFGITPTKVWLTVSNQKRARPADPISKILVNVTPEMQAKIDALLKRK